ncbi:hypothetical protein BJX76DRAFT_15514 [Aspergillus varians]
MPDQLSMQILHAAGSAGTRVSLPTTPTPTTKEQTTSFGPQRRRKTVSIVHPSTHAPQSDPIVESARLSRPSTMDVYPRSRYLREMSQRNSQPPPSPAMKPEYSPRWADAPEGNFLVRSKSSGRLHSAAMERRLTIPGDPRDTRKAGALTFAGTTTSTTAPSPSVVASRPSAGPPSPSSPSPARLHHPPSLPNIPRLPQSRFSFEVQHPLRKVALTSHLKSASVDRSPPAADSVSTPRHSSLYDRHRKSVPNFHLSHAETQPASDSPQISPAAPTTAQRGTSALSSDVGSTVRVLSPNATKRRKSTLYSQQEPPGAKRRMPSSTASFAQGRSYADEYGTPVKGAERFGQRDGLRSSIADESRSKNEDIFLNIARSDSSRRESQGRSELRRVIAT